jgi:cell division septation protein DedD
VEKAPGPLVIEPLRETVSPAPALMAPAAPIQASTPACPSATGDVYFQVGLVNFPQGSDLVEQLKQQGYTVKLAPLEGTSSHRVLVGPVNDAAVQEVTGRKLREQGYTFFRRRW